MKQQRRFQNLPHAQQTILRRQFAWLLAVHDAQPLPPGVSGLAVSVFDHWLSEDEAREHLAHVPPAEQARRDGLHARFAQLVLAQTEALTYVWRGRRKDRAVFRRFTDVEAPRTGQRPFRLVLPAWQAVFLEGWDDTHSVFSTSPETVQQVKDCAAACGLFVLPME